MKFDNEQLADKSPCANIRADLKMCLLESDCCKIVSFLKAIIKASGNFTKYCLITYRIKRHLGNVYRCLMARFQMSVLHSEIHFLNAKDQF